MVTLTVKPVEVDAVAPNVGVSAVPVSADAVTLPLPAGYPARDVATDRVADCAGLSPVTVSGKVLPLAVPAVTVPAVMVRVNV